MKDNLAINFHRLKLFTFGFLQILLYLWLAEFLSKHLQIPSAIIALLLCLSVCILLKKVPKSLDCCSRILLKYLPVFFIPLIVSVSLYWQQISQYWFVCLVALLVSTALTLVVVGRLIEINIARLN